MFKMNTILKCRRSNLQDTSPLKFIILILAVIFAVGCVILCNTYQSSYDEHSHEPLEFRLKSQDKTRSKGELSTTRSLEARPQPTKNGKNEAKKTERQTSSDKKVSKNIQDSSDSSRPLKKKKLQKQSWKSYISSWFRSALQREPSITRRSKSDDSIQQTSYIMMCMPRKKALNPVQIYPSNQQSVDHDYAKESFLTH